MTTSNSYNFGLLILRLGFGGLMLTHGIPKLLKLIEGNMEFADPIGIGATATLILAVIAEVICPLLIIIGFKTRLATIPAIITMWIGAFIVHAGDPIDVKEKALMYLCAFLVIAFTGPGKYSVDKK